MKSKIPGLLSFCILIVATAGIIHAQDNKMAFNNKDVPHNPAGRSEIMSIQKLREVEVNIRAVRDFLNQFNQTENVNWYKISDGYIASFTQKNEIMMTGYDFNGNWLYNMASYPEDKLPRDVWHLVKSTYYDFSITWINEIRNSERKIYIVHLKNKYLFQNVKVCNGEIEEMEKLRIEPIKE